MRVIAGKYRTRTLLAPAGMDTRPTSDRLRETLFNVLENGPVNRVCGATMADLFAGSGAVGIEALSRGAERVIFVEQSAVALEVLKGNLSRLGLRDEVAVEKRSVADWLRRRARLTDAPQAAKSRCDLVFLDPPWDAVEEYERTLTQLGGEAAEVLAADAWVIAEHRRKSGLLETYGRLQRFRVLEQGDAGLSFYALGE
uniref:Putative methyltransferase n=1 Tax=mine drainage metagenome TaxID=410659 RepID=E6PYS6_9ZZZZ